MTKKLKLITKEFIDNLLAVKDAVLDYPVIPSLENILMEGDGKRIFITASNNKISITVNFKHKGASFKTLLPYLTIKKVLSICGEEVTLELKDGFCHIVSQNHETIIPTDDPVNFPDKYIDNDLKLSIELSKEIIIALKKATNFVSNDVLRLGMCGILFDIKNSSGTIVGTDSHVIFYEHFELTDNAAVKVILPVKAINLLTESYKSLMIYKDSFTFYSDYLQLKGDLIDADYPEYENIITRQDLYHGKISFNKLDFINAIEKISILRFNSWNTIKIEMTENNISISSVGFEEENRFRIYINGNSSKNGISFNINMIQLLKVLKSLDGETVFMKISDTDKPIVVSSNGSKRLIMQVMV